MGVFATICIKFLPGPECHGQPEKMTKIEIGCTPEAIRRCWISRDFVMGS
jgi:hypothetical protein